MPSSSSKQAELRRLMKLQLEKQKKQELEKKNAPPKSILKSSSTKPSSNSAVSSLLAAYGDESDSEKEESTRVSWPQDEQELKKTRIIESAVAQEPERKRARFEVETREQQVKVATTETNVSENETNETKRVEIIPSKVKTSQQQHTSLDTEMEFQALLGEAGKLVEQDSTTNEKETEPVEEEKQVEEEEADSSTIDTTEIEQVSYEARIAKLRLKAAARRKKKAPTPAVINVDTYTPELAEQDNETDSKPSAASDTLTPLEILRQKRKARARQLQDDQDK